MKKAANKGAARKKSASTKKVHLLVTRSSGGKKPTVNISQAKPTARSKSTGASAPGWKTNPPLGGGNDPCPPMYTLQYQGHAFICTLKFMNDSQCYYECTMVGTAGPYDPRNPPDPSNP